MPLHWVRKTAKNSINDVHNAYSWSTVWAISQSHCQQHGYLHYITLHSTISTESLIKYINRLINVQFCPCERLRMKAVGGQAANSLNDRMTQFIVSRKSVEKYERARGWVEIRRIDAKCKWRSSTRPKHCWQWNQFLHRTFKTGGKVNGEMSKREANGEISDTSWRSVATSVASSQWRITVKWSLWL